MHRSLGYCATICWILMTRAVIAMVKTRRSFFMLNKPLLEWRWIGGRIGEKSANLVRVMRVIPVSCRHLTEGGEAVWFSILFRDRQRPNTALACLRLLKNVVYCSLPIQFLPRRTFFRYSYRNGSVHTPATSTLKQIRYIFVFFGVVHFDKTAIGVLGNAHLVYFTSS
jgi:hypothetical protein